MRRSFLSNFALLLFTNILVKPFWIISDLWVQRTTGEEYGMYFVLFNISLILNIVCDAGINNYNNRKIAAVPKRFGNYFAKASMLRIFLAALYLLLLFSSALIFNYSGKELHYIFILGINQVLLSSILFLRSNLTALKYFKTDSIMAVMDRVVMIAGLLFYVFVLDQTLSIQVFIYTQFFAYLCTFAIVLITLFQHQKLTLPKWDFKFSKTLLQKSVPYAVIVVLMMLYTYTDSIMLDQMLSNGNWQNMIYAQSHRILMAVNNYAYLIAIILLPSFASMIKDKSSKVQELLQLSVNALLIALSFFIIIAAFYADEIITLLYAKFEKGFDVKALLAGVQPLNSTDLNYSQKVFACLMFGLIPMGINYTYGALLTAKGEMKTLNLIAFTGVILNVSLNYILIPDHGALGAAVVSVCTQYLCGILQIVFTYKYFQFKIQLQNILRFMLGLAILVLSVVSLNKFLPWFWVSLISSFFLIPIVFILKIVSLAQLKAGLQKIKIPNKN